MRVPHLALSSDPRRDIACMQRWTAFLAQQGRNAISSPAQSPNALWATMQQKGSARAPSVRLDSCARRHRLCRLPVLLGTFLKLVSLPALSAPQALPARRRPRPQKLAPQAIMLSKHRWCVRLVLLDSHAQLLRRYHQRVCPALMPGQLQPYASLVQLARPALSQQAQRQSQLVFRDISVWAETHHAHHAQLAFRAAPRLRPLHHPVRKEHFHLVAPMSAPRVPQDGHVLLRMALRTAHVRKALTLLGRPPNAHPAQPAPHAQIRPVHS